MTEPARPLGGDWVEIRIVYQSGGNKHPHHAHGKEALRDIAHFVLSFSGDLARTFGALHLEHALGRLWRHIHDHSGCDCGRTRH